MVNKTMAIIAAVVLLIGGFCMVQAQERADEGRKVEVRAITVEEYMRAEREIRKLVEDGEVSAEDAETRLVEMRRMIADENSGDRTEGVGSMSVAEYRQAEEKIRKLVEDGKVSAEAAEIRLREMRSVISE